MGHRRKASSVKVSESRQYALMSSRALMENCEECGKKRYTTRKGARLARRRTNGQHMSVYRCGEYWHIGHTPWQIRKGKEARSNTLGDFERRAS